MPRITAAFRKLSLLFHRRRFQRELSEEMAFHRSQAERELITSGMSPDQARAAARRRFGNETLQRERSHEAVGFRFESLWQDVRYALRQMRRSPGFTLAVVVTLTLGIGVTTAIFSAVDAALLRSLPYPHAERIISIRDEKIRGISTGGLVSVPRFYDLAARSRSFSALSFFYFEDTTLIDGAHLPEHMAGVGANAGFFRVFGVNPLLGRAFDEQDDRPGKPASVVLSYASWQRIFGGNPAVIGHAINVDKQAATVIGVMPSDFNYPAGTEMWRTAQFDPASWKSYRGDGTRFINVFARLNENVTPAHAQNELNLLAAQLVREYPSTDADWHFDTSTLREYTYGAMRPALLILLGASIVLLLIGCVNVVSLLLSRATAREREIALRQALGASRKRVVRQLLTENFLLALIGGITGLGAAFVLVRWASAKLPPSFHLQGHLAIDWSVAGFALAVCLGAGLIFGLAPAIQADRSDLNRSLRTGDGLAGSLERGRVRSALISVQIGFSLMLLVGASLLTQSLWRLVRTPLGFNPDHLLVFNIQLPWEGTPAAADGFFAAVQRRVEAMPGVAAVGQISALPTLNWHSRSSYDADWMRRTAHQDSVRAENRHLAGRYLEAMHIPLLAGRDLRPDDGSAVLVNQEFVRRYSPDQSPVGHYLLNNQSTGTASHNGIQIVGVIGNVRGTSGSIAGEVLPEIYYQAAGLNVRWFVVRAQVPPEQLAGSIRRAVHEIDPQESIGNVGTMNTRLSAAVAQPRVHVALLVGLAAIALALACVGTYGVIAYSVAQRRQEIGVRMALGATRGQIARLFLGRSAMAAAIGLAGGSLAALMLVRLLRSQLYGISPYDPLTFITAIVLLLVPVLLASLRPALKAASINPVEALRAE